MRPVARAAIPLAVAAHLALLAPAVAVVETYSRAPAVAIPDALPPGPGTPQSVSDTLSVPDSGSIHDLDVTVTLQHPGHGDLSIHLTDPSGAVTVRLISTEGGPGDGFSNVTFDDEAAGLPPGFVVNGTCLVDETYRPAPDSLSDFDGLEIHGDWTLTVSDNFVGDASDCDCDGFAVGPPCPRTLDEWSLTVDFVGPADEDGGGDGDETSWGCAELAVLLLVILVLLVILWLLLSRGRP